MEISVNIALCALVVLSSFIRGQNNTSPLRLATSGPDLLEGVSANSSNETAGSTPVAPPAPTQQNSTVAPTPAETAVPASSSTTAGASTAPPPPERSTVPGNLTEIPGLTTQNQTFSTPPPASASPPTTHRPKATSTSSHTTTTSTQPSTTAAAAAASTPQPSSPRQHTSTSARPESTTTTSPAPRPTTTQSSTSAQDRAHDTPSELNVGDEDVSSPSMDPLLAGLVAMFIVMAAIVSLVIFLKFRRRNERPEFRRLQDLPMDDMMEDTPLSMYSY